MARQPCVGLGLPQKLPPFLSVQCLPFRRNSVSPAVASSDFVTIVSLQIGLSAQCQPPAILVGRCFLLGLSPLADRSPFLSVGSSLLRPYMTWLLKALPRSHDVDMHVSVLTGINGISYVLMMYFYSVYLMIDIHSYQNALFH